MSEDRPWPRAIQAANRADRRRIGRVAGKRATYKKRGQLSAVLCLIAGRLASRHPESALSGEEYGGRIWATLGDPAVMLIVRLSLAGALPDPPEEYSMPDDLPTDDELGFLRLSRLYVDPRVGEDAYVAAALRAVPWLIDTAVRKIADRREAVE